MIIVGSLEVVHPYETSWEVQSGLSIFLGSKHETLHIGDRRAVQTQISSMYQG